jgi:capsular polysaccharide biosynthesis protein
VSVANILNFLNPGAPKGVIPDASAWAAQANLRRPQWHRPQPTAWCRQIHPGEYAFHSLPVGETRAPGDEFDGVRWTVSPPARLHYMQGARVLGAEGAVISPDNAVFADFTIPPGDRWREHSCFRRRRIPRTTRLAGWYATIAWPQSHFYFHWMLESLPRIALLEEFVASLDGVFVAGPLQRYQQRSLELLGIAREKLIVLDAQSHFAPEHLFVPQAFARFNPTRWMPGWFRRSFVQLPPASPPTPGRIYISRGDAPARRVANESEVQAALAPLGIVPVQLSALAFEQQARLFAGADLVVALHGAGLSNLLFCRPGTRILEIFAPGWMPPCFFTLASSVGAHYTHLVARPAASSSRGPQFDDVQIPVEPLIERLRAWADA